MIDTKPAPLELSRQYQAALSRWDTEGGAGPDGPQEGSCPDEQPCDVPPTTAELVQLRISVIALENVLIGLLATASREQLDKVLGMADFISPRSGFTKHALTIHAASQMRNLVERSGHFRNHNDANYPPVALPYKRTPVFDEHTLPAGLRKEHRTKPGVWGVIRVLEGRVRYEVLAPASEVILDADHPGLILPDVPHFVEPLGPMQMLVEFFKQAPDLKFQPCRAHSTECGDAVEVELQPSEISR